MRDKLTARLAELTFWEEQSTESTLKEEDDEAVYMAGNSLPALDIPMSGPNRSSPSPTNSVASAQANSGNAANYASPLPAGHQQDLNYLYSQIQELSAVLKSNREKTAVLTKAAEEIGVRQVP